jgi:tetratricopeptide (TPR) repeat protein
MFLASFPWFRTPAPKNPPPQPQSPKTPEQIATALVTLLRTPVTTAEAFHALLTTHKIEESDLTQLLRECGGSLSQEDVAKLVPLQPWMNLELRTVVQELEQQALPQAELNRGEGKAAVSSDRTPQPDGAGNFESTIASYRGSSSDLTSARSLFQQGELTQALALVEQLKSMGKSIELLELEVEIRGAIVAKNRSPEEEIIWLNPSGKQDISDNFEDTIASLDLGKLIELLGLDAEIRGAIDFQQRSPEEEEAIIWLNRGTEKYMTGDMVGAIADYDQALKIKPDYHYAWNGRGNSLDNLGQYEAAIASYDQALKIKPDDHQTWNNRGNSLDHLGGVQKQLHGFHGTIIGSAIPDDYRHA